MILEQELEKREKLILQREQELEKGENSFLIATERIKENSSNDEKITFNIREQLFTTFKKDLTKHFTDNYFTTLLASDRYLQNKNEKNEYFINSNPKYFNDILNYLICGKINLDEKTEGEIIELKEQFDYFLLDFPLLEWDVTIINYNYYKMSNENKTLKQIKN